ncbi:MAG: hypothetical protein K6E89_02730 [Sphaerochaetaceae bacterium]|nr:hypothetical protein [Sphaerochaetaceae bacterium]
MRKVLVLLLAILMVFALVACKDEQGVKGKWVSTYTETETEDEETIESTITATLEFDGNGGAKLTSHLDCLKINGVDMTSMVPEEKRTEVLTGTYTDTEITVSYEEGGIKITNTGTYSISGNKLTLTVDDESHVFTKQ